MFRHLYVAFFQLARGVIEMLIAILITRERIVAIYYTPISGLRVERAVDG